MTDPDRPWTAFYGPAVRKDIAEPRYRTLGDMIGRCAHRLYGPKPAFTCCLPNGMNGTLSFAQADEMSDALAVYLREVCGLVAGRPRRVAGAERAVLSRWRPLPCSRRAASLST
jgi:long-chain acyl-CoA synthetase